jgi:hypothetical protein
MHTFEWNDEHFKQTANLLSYRSVAHSSVIKVLSLSGLIQWRMGSSVTLESDVMWFQCPRDLYLVMPGEELLLAATS